MCIYLNEEYLSKNPTWDQEDGPWKAKQVLKMLKKHSLIPKKIMDVGCGAGSVLSSLYNVLPNDTNFYGYDISPHAIAFCEKLKKERMVFSLGDIASVNQTDFDLAMALDVFEHLENYYEFLRAFREKSTYKIFHIPLELSLQTILRMWPLLGARKSVGHLHYFTKDIALEVLKETGYQVIDYVYTSEGLEVIRKSFKTFLAKIPRTLAFAIHKDLAVRILGGYSLLVLAK